MLYNSITELKNLRRWIKDGEYVRDDAPDEICRAIQNRIMSLEASDAMQARLWLLELNKTTQYAEKLQGESRAWALGRASGIEWVLAMITTT